MAAKTVDQSTLTKAVNWSRRYFLGSKDKRLPSDRELETQFPGAGITQRDIEIELKKFFGVKNLSEVGTRTIKTVDEILEETHQKENAKGENKPEGRPFYAHGRTSALGILAELEAVEPILKKHLEETQAKLEESLTPPIRELLPKLGIDNASDEVVVEIVRESASRVLLDAYKIQASDQINGFLADSVAQTIIATPQIAEKLKANDTQVHDKTLEQTAEVAKTHQDDLEKAAVLSHLHEVAALKPDSPETKDLIAQNTEGNVEIQAALTLPIEQETLKSSQETYLNSYKEALAEQLHTTQGQIPTLDQLQRAKAQANEIAVNMTRDTLTKTPGGKKLAAKIDLPTLTNSLALSTGLINLPPPHTSALSFGSTSIFANPKHVEEAYLSLLSYDQEKLSRALKQTSVEIENYKNKKSLSYKERVIYLEAKKRHARYVSAEAFHVKETKRAQAYRSIFAQPFNGRVGVVSQQIWFAEQRIPKFLPKVFTLNNRLAAGAAFGSLGFSFSGIKVGSVFSRMAAGFKSSFIMGIGMGLTPVGLIKNSPPYRVARGLRNALMYGFGGLALLFYMLSPAAFAGFVSGALLGLTTGTAVGLALTLPLGPLGWAIAPVVVPLTALSGMIIGGVAAGLIAHALSSGSVTAGAAGIGAGAGGTIGAVVGFNVGVAAGAGIMTLAIGLCIGSGLCAPFAPLLIAVSPAIVTVFGSVGAAIGATVGTLIGGFSGYVIGKYVFSPTFSLGKSIVQGIRGGIVGVGGGILSTIGSFITGLASTLWGGAAALATNIWGALSGGANLIVNGIAALPLPSTLSIAVVTGGPIVGAGLTAAILIPGTLAIATVASEDQPTPPIIPGENPYFTLTKTATPNTLTNSSLPTEIKFTITFTAKETNLTIDQITDQLVVQKEGFTFIVPADKNGSAISPPCASTIPTTLPAFSTWTCDIFVNATIPPDRDYTDSLVANTVIFTITPDGQPQLTDQITSSVTIGTPPNLCAILNIIGSFSSTEQNYIQEVCLALDRSPMIGTLLRNAGTINVIKDTSISGGEVRGGKNVHVNTFASPSHAKYVLIHELGHVISNYNNSAYLAFQSSGAFQKEGLMPTYPRGEVRTDPIIGPNESFAEMITEYVNSKQYNHPARSWSGFPGGTWNNPGGSWKTFAEDRPLHFNFAKNQIFGGVSY